MATKLIEIRKPTKKEKHAEIVFIRKDESNKIHTIYGCKCYESWEQWGASKEILGDNVDDIEKWRRNDTRI